MSQTSQDQAAIERMWQECQRATGSVAELAGAFAFGASPAMADTLAGEVRHGPKRATAGLLLEHERDGEPLPRPGDYWVVLGGQGQPVCVIRTTEVQIKPLNQVDAAFAWDEGEGERTLAWWRRAHGDYFARRCEEIGVPFSEDLPTVFERFDLVWPQPSITDQQAGGRATSDAALSGTALSGTAI